MLTKSEPQILAAMLDSTRQLTKFYLEELSDVDKLKSFSFGDFLTNNIQWIVAHITWAEDSLILRGIGNQGISVPWFELFRLGAPKPGLSEVPSYEDSLEKLDLVHQTSMTFLNSLSDATLDQPNHFGRKIMGEDSKRVLLRHCIRHEGVHCGQLSWLARMHGKQII
jgi:hypothetical protein